MKRKVKKILLVVLAIFLISILAGCEPHFLDGMEIEDCAEDFVYNYWIAMINRQYELAKWYCITNGVWYNKTDEWEEYINTNSEGEASVLVYFHYFYKPTEVVGNSIIVYAKISVDKIAFPDSYEILVDTFEYEMEVIETPPLGRLKLK